MQIISCKRPYVVVGICQSWSVTPRSPNCQSYSFFARTHTVADLGRGVRGRQLPSAPRPPFCIALWPYFKSKTANQPSAQTSKNYNILQATRKNARFLNFFQCKNFCADFQRFCLTILGNFCMQNFASFVRKNRPKFSPHDRPLDPHLHYQTCAQILPLDLQTTITIRGTT